MKKRIVNIMTYSTMLNAWGLIQVEGYELDNQFSMYKSYKSWTITHNATGLSVASGKTKKEALENLEMVKDKINQINPELMKKHIDRYVEELEKLERRIN